MIERAKKLAEVFKKHDVEYLFIGKFGAILYGYPGTTQDIDIFPSKERSNCKRLGMALKELGFDLGGELEEAILAGKDFIQIRGGPFPIDIVFAPDGIKSFEDAKKRSQLIGEIFFCASIDDIIESEAPRASARGIFTASAKPAEAYPPSLTCSSDLPSPKRFVQAGKFFGRRELRRIPFLHSSPSFRAGHSAKAGKRASGRQRDREEIPRLELFREELRK